MIIRSNYCHMVPELKKRGINSVDGIVLDLGVSSYQLDHAERGFTYREDVPLDMRMDQRQTKTAEDIVNTYSESELYRIIRDYGEDKFAKNYCKTYLSGKTGDTDSYHRRINGDYKKSHSDESPGNGRTSFQENISGAQD